MKNLQRQIKDDALEIVEVSQIRAYACLLDMCTISKRRTKKFVQYVEASTPGCDAKAIRCLTLSDIILNRFSEEVNSNKIRTHILTLNANMITYHCIKYPKDMSVTFRTIEFAREFWNMHIKTKIK